MQDKFIELSSNWHDGQFSMMYAIASTGDLTCGTIRPYNDETSAYCTDNEWLYQLYSELSCEIYRCLKMIGDKDHEDKEDLRDFYEFVDKKMRSLENENDISSTF